VHVSIPADFKFYDLPHIARWAVDLSKWAIQRDSKEFEFLLNRIPEEARSAVSEQSCWRHVKVALAKELIVRRMAEMKPRINNSLVTRSF